MILGKSYLIRKINSDKSKEDLREIICLGVSESAYKIQFVTKTRSGSSWLFLGGDSNEPFWTLKTDFDKTGDSKFQIIEEL
jgi:hypothetical protein